MTAPLDVDADGLAAVPTVADLARRGLARQMGPDGIWSIAAAGYAEMSAAMAHNAGVLRSDVALRRRLEAEASKARG